MIIKNKNWEAHIEAAGADLTALRYQNKSILREGDPTETPFLMGSPLLFPPNRTDGGTFTFNHTTYHLPINEKNRNNHLHGLLHNAPFQIENQGNNKLVCGHHVRPEEYPFPCTLTRTFILTEEGLDDTITIENTGNQAMPFVVGFHTTFDDPEYIKLPLEEKWERDDRYLATGRKERMDAKDQKLTEGTNPRGILYSGTYPIAQHQCEIDNIVFSVSPSFTQWVLYSGKGFFCVEPQSGMVNGLNLKDGCTILPVGASWQGTMSYRLKHEER